VTSNSPWQYRSFRWLAIGSAVNSLGNAISPIALAFTVLDLGGSATTLGLVIAVYALADVAAVLGGGLLGDRLPRTAVMCLSNGTAGVVQAGVGVGLLAGVVTIPTVAVAGGVIGALGSLASPSTQAALPGTVPTDSLRGAITVRRIGQNIAQIVGAGLAGLLVSWIAPGGAILVDAATFLVATLCFQLVHVPQVARSHVDPPRRVLSDVREGWRELWRHSWLWSLIAMALIYHLFYGGAQGVLGPVVVGGRLGPAAWGYTLSAMMVGFVIGGLASLRWKPRRMLLAGELGLLLTVCFPVAMALSHNLVVILAGAALHGFGLEIFSVGWDLAIQENVPPHLLARIYSFDQLGSFLARPLGLALTGPMAAVSGARTWLLVVAGAMLVAELLPFGITDVRRLQRRSLAPAAARADAAPP